MRNVLGLRAMVAFGLVMAAAAAMVPAWADDPTDDAEKERLKRWAQQLRESVDWYRVFSGRDPKEPMKPEIVMRWANPTRLQKGETALVMWADAGRPEALASVYPWNGNLTYECVSLARDKGLIATEDGRSVWAPTAPGITFRELPDAPAPAKTATARLTQMREIAEPFKVTMISRKSGVEDREEMRLLPKPIYRYDLAAAKLAHPELIDGAVFAFVQGTDPEAVLMIEAVKKGDKTVWQYGFGRATGWTVEARLGSMLIWTAPDISTWNNPTSPGRVLGRRLVN
jgi:hypothetical protein